MDILFVSASIVTILMGGYAFLRWVKPNIKPLISRVIELRRAHARKILDIPDPKAGHGREQEPLGPPGVPDAIDPKSQTPRNDSSMIPASKEDLIRIGRYFKRLAFEGDSPGTLIEDEDELLTLGPLHDHPGVLLDLLFENGYRYTRFWVDDEPGKLVRRVTTILEDCWSNFESGNAGLALAQLVDWDDRELWEEVYHASQRGENPEEIALEKTKTKVSEQERHKAETKKWLLQEWAFDLGVDAGYC